MGTTTQPHWRDRFIARSEIISDGWQVTLAWLGRAAEVTLFVTMIAMLANIVIPFSDWFVGGVLIVQMITLDVAAFGLETMANHVKRNGNAEAAEKAANMSKALIAIMIVTALNVVVNLRFGSTVPQVKTFTGYIDDILIFIRIIAVILYGQTIRSLREVSQAIEIAKQDESDDLKSQIATLEQNLQSEKQRAAQELAATQQAIQDERSRAAQLQKDLELAHDQAAMTLQTVGNQGDLVNDLSGQIEKLRGQLEQVSYEKQTMVSQVNRSRQEVSDLSAKLQRAEKQVSDLSGQLKDVTSQLQVMTSQVRSQSEAPKRSHATIIQLSQKTAEGRSKHNPLEVKAWCEQHTDLTQSEQAAQLGISDAANLRRILRRAREIEEGGQVSIDQAVNDL